MSLRASARSACAAGICRQAPGYFTIPLRAGRNELTYGGDASKHDYQQLGSEYEPLKVLKDAQLDVWNVDMPC